MAGSLFFQILLLILMHLFIIHLRATESGKPSAEYKDGQQEDARTANVVSKKKVADRVKSSKDNIEADDVKESSSDGEARLFGASVGGSLKLIDVQKTYPKPSKFHEEYVVPRKPVLVKNACRHYPAYSMWQDDSYFVRLPQALTHWVERDQGFISFKKMVEQRHSNVDVLIKEIPFYLRNDVLMPPPLVCNPVKSQLSSHSLWITWNGVKLPFREEEKNIIRCIFVGRQDLVLINADDFTNKVRPNLDEVDFDYVDVSRFPLLKDITYLQTSVEAGSCIFIPVNWLWQASSTNRTIAVDVAWNHKTRKSEDCSSYDKPLPLVAFDFKDLKSNASALEDTAIYYFASYLLSKESYNFTEFENNIKKDKVLLRNMTEWTDEFEEITSDLFVDLDINQDSLFSIQDFEILSPSSLPAIRQQLDDRLLDLEEVMTDQQAEVKASKESISKKPGASSRDDVQSYVDQYTKALQDAIMESLEELSVTGKLPDFEKKLTDKRKQLGLDLPVKEPIPEKPQPTAREQAKAKLEEAKVKKEKKSEKAEDYFEPEESYPVVDEDAVEEILAEEDDSNEMREKKITPMNLSLKKDSTSTKQSKKEDEGASGRKTVPRKQAAVQEASNAGSGTMESKQKDQKKISGNRRKASKDEL